MEAQVWLESLLGSAPLGIGFKNVHGQLEYVNPALCELLGYPADELCGCTIGELIDAEAASLLQSERSIGEESVRPRGMTWLAKDGRRVPTVTLFGAALDRDSRYAGSCMLVFPERVAAQIFAVSGYGDMLRRLATVIREGQHLLSALDRTPNLSIEVGAHQARIAWPASPAWLGRLSEREREVTQGVLEGMPLRAIAERHHITTHTVRNHLKSVFRKLQVHSQQQLVARYLRDALPRSIAERSAATD